MATGITNGMSLKVSIVGLQIKQVKNALQYLAKIGSEVLLEALPEKLILRSINSSRSAYASITFSNSFFDAYNVFGANVVQSGILAKQALALFRTQHMVKLFLELTTADNRLVATVSADNGMEKEYRIPCMESEILQTTVDKDMLPTTVSAAANELNRLLSSFQNNLEEITIIATPEESEEEEGRGQGVKAVQLHSFLDPAKGHADKSLHTQLAVDTEKVFLGYRHASADASEVTFNLKDFKAMLVLCEGLGANVTICFDQPGSPLLVQPLFHNNPPNPLEEYVAAELVLATLLEAARLSDAGPGTVAFAAAKRAARADTPGGGRIAGDTPWGAARGAAQTPGSGAAARTPAERSGRGGTTAQRPTRFREAPEPPRYSTPHKHAFPLESPARQEAAALDSGDGQQHESGAANSGSSLRFRRTPLEGRVAREAGSAAVMQQLFGLPDSEDGAPLEAGQAHGPSAAAGSNGVHAEGAQHQAAGAMQGKFRSGLLDDGFYSESEPQAHADAGGSGLQESLGQQPDGGHPSQAATGRPTGPLRAPGEVPDEGMPNWNGSLSGPGVHHQSQELAAAGQSLPSQGLAESQWQDRGPAPRRYLAAGLEDDEDEEYDADAVPSTP